MQPRRVAAPGLAAALVAASVAASLLAVVIVSSGGAWESPGVRDLPVDVVIGVTFPLCALLVLAGAAPVRAVAALLLLSGSAAAAAAVSTAVAAAADRSSAGVAVAVQVQSFVWVPAFLPILTVVPLVFPDGRLPSRRWRPVLAAAVLGTVAMTVGTALHPTTFVGETTLEKPVTSAVLSAPFFAIGAVLSTVSMVLALASLVLRWRRATGLTRRQVSVLLVAIGVLAVDVIVTSALPWPASVVIQSVAVALLPIAITVAVTRHRLYDLDTALCRTVTGVSLAGCLAGLYLTLFALLGAVLPAGSAAASVVAAGITGLALQPLARHLAGAVDRWFYGDRAQPQVLLTRLGERLREATTPEEVTEAVRATVAEHLRLGSVTVDLLVGPVRCADDANDPNAVPLHHRGELVGRLVVEPRPGERVLDPRDREVLQVVAVQVAPAVAAVRLSARLQRSRELLVTAREEERRRLRRDLHDGVGAALAGVRLQLESAQDRVSDPRTRRMVETAVSAVAEAVDGVRHATEDLRPPALDELGLASCLRLLAERMSTPDVPVRAEVEPLPRLGAAVEVACYRIAAEALTNARRHANADRIDLCVQVGSGAIRLRVVDNGTGMPATTRAGAVGVDSMRLRAEEVGGMLLLESSDRGTSVEAVLPMTEER
jgi:signal transduction histidine kinase